MANEIERDIKVTQCGLRFKPPALIVIYINIQKDEQVRIRSFPLKNIRKSVSIDKFAINFRNSIRHKKYIDLISDIQLKRLLMLMKSYLEGKEGIENICYQAREQYAKSLQELKITKSIMFGEMQSKSESFAKKSTNTCQLPSYSSLFTENTKVNYLQEVGNNDSFDLEGFIKKKDFLGNGEKKFEMKDFDKEIFTHSQMEDNTKCDSKKMDKKVLKYEHGDYRKIDNELEKDKPYELDMTDKVYGEIQMLKKKLMIQNMDELKLLDEKPLNKSVPIEEPGSLVAYEKIDDVKIKNFQESIFDEVKITNYNNIQTEYDGKTENSLGQKEKFYEEFNDALFEDLNSFNDLCPQNISGQKNSNLLVNKLSESEKHESKISKINGLATEISFLKNSIISKSDSQRSLSTSPEIDERNLKSINQEEILDLNSMDNQIINENKLIINKSLFINKGNCEFSSENDIDITKKLQQRNKSLSPKKFSKTKKMLKQANKKSTSSSSEEDTVIARGCAKKCSKGSKGINNFTANANNDSQLLESDSHHIEEGINNQIKNSSTFTKIESLEQDENQLNDYAVDNYEDKPDSSEQFDEIEQNDNISEQLTATESENELNLAESSSSQKEEKCKSLKQMNDQNNPESFSEIEINEVDSLQEKYLRNRTSQVNCNELFIEKNEKLDQDIEELEEDQIEEEIVSINFDTQTEYKREIDIVKNSKIGNVFKESDLAKSKLESTLGSNIEENSDVEKRSEIDNDIMNEEDEKLSNLSKFKTEDSLATEAEFETDVDANISNSNEAIMDKSRIKNKVLPILTDSESNIEANLKKKNLNDMININDIYDDDTKNYSYDDNDFNDDDSLNELETDGHWEDNSKSQNSCSDNENKF